MDAAGLDLHISANNYILSADTIAPRFFCRCSQSGLCKCLYKCQRAVPQCSFTGPTGFLHPYTGSPLCPLGRCLVTSKRPVRARLLLAPTVRRSLSFTSFGVAEDMFWPGFSVGGVTKILGTCRHLRNICSNNTTS